MKKGRERASKTGVVEMPNGTVLKGTACLPTTEEEYNAGEQHSRQKFRTGNTSPEKDPVPDITRQ
jgi:hypothetical protein